MIGLYDMLKKIYYSECKSYPNVDPANPVEKDLSETLEIWGARLGVGSFLGIEVSKNKILQLREEENGDTYTEFLDTRTLDIQHTILTDDDLEELIYTIFKGHDLIQYLNERNHSWLFGNLKK